MDGFSIIPKDGTVHTDNAKPIAQTKSPIPVGAELQAIRQASQKKPADVIWWVMLLVVAGAIGYIGYLVAMRFIILSKISGVSQELVQMQASFNRNEIEDLKTVDQRLKVINSRLSTHVLVASVFETINQHIRNTTQISEYKISTSDADVNVTLSAIAPTFKDMAEQTERLFIMKDQNLIKGFAITNLAYEQDTHKVRFTVKLVLAKNKYSALNMRPNRQP